MPIAQPNLLRLLEDITSLAGIVEPGTPGWTRRFPSAAYLEGRDWIRQRMEQAGLETSIDAAGNLLAQRRGSENLPPLVAGSHSDTVYGGGRYDGPLGVLGALEAARCLAEAGISLRHPLIIADYLAEEANAFGVSCVGSRALAYGLQPEWLARETGGQSLGAAIKASGGQPERLGQALLQPGQWAACLELHIEQGPALEQRGSGLAAVSGITGIRRGTFELHGQADHAGTAPMELRHDALTAAAALTLALESLCRAQPGAVGTVGRLEVAPNQSNVVPGMVTLTAEMRSLAPAIIDRIWEGLLNEARAACAARGVILALTARTDSAPAAPPEWLFDTVLKVCRSLDPGALTLPSGAGHDTGHLSHVAPAAMIFVPSIGGRSHCPEEATAPEHLALGATAIANTLLALDTQL